ncbi:MAG: hypothetical protein QM770_01560 [Tepidisphaeraceae bacterium]
MSTSMVSRAQAAPTTVPAAADRLTELKLERVNLCRMLVQRQKEQRAVGAVISTADQLNAVLRLADAEADLACTPEARAQAYDAALLLMRDHENELRALFGRGLVSQADIDDSRLNTIDLQIRVERLRRGE